MGTTKSVTVSSLEASVNLEGHTGFLAALLARDDLDLARRAAWIARLDEALAHSQDPALYLAVIGEFSSGKSTLVNALIREAILPADVLPATTATAVLVRSGPQRRLRVDYLDGQTDEITDGEVIREQVARLITVEETARRVSRVTIDHPAALLREGFVAVDLPGSNVENARHVEVTGKTIRELCDTALVAIPANIPVSETLAEFLRIHLDEVLHRCVFVVTKIDCLPSRDRVRVLDTVQGRLATKLGIAPPLVLGASASALLGEPLPDGTGANTLGAAGDAYRELQAQFLETEGRIILFFQERRKLILLERAVALLAVLSDGIQKDLRAVVDRCRRDREVLAASLLPPLRPFLAECRVRHGQALEVRLQTLEDNLLKTFAVFRRQHLQALWDSLAATRSRSQVIQAATHGADALMTRARGALWEELLKTLARIGPEVQQEMASFGVRFLEIYGAVADSESVIAGLDLPGTIPDNWAVWTRPEFVNVRQEQRHQNRYKAIGAFLGAFVGLFAFAFVLGSKEGMCSSCFMALLVLVSSPFIGALLASNQPALVNSLGKAYWLDLGPAVEIFLSRSDSVVLRHFEEAQRTAKERIDPVLTRCLTRYDALVQDRIVGAESRIAEVLWVERRADGALAELERRRLDLQQARSGLQQVQKL